MMSGMKTYLPVEGQMLVQVINATFMERCGKFQANKPEMTEMVVTFHLALGATESGSRNLEVAYFAAYNYVEVRTREIVDVYDEDLDKETQATTDWKVLGSHDSGWRDLTNQVLRDERIQRLATRGDSWFELRGRAV